MKLHIIDEDNEEYEVETVEEKSDIDKTKDSDIESLSDDEIKSLKSLAHVADKLIKLVDESITDEDDDEDDKKHKDTDIDDDEDEDEDEDEEDDDKDNKEEVVDTDKLRDSVGKIEKHRSFAADSVEVQDSIAEAWSKRFKGGNK